MTGRPREVSGVSPCLHIAEQGATAADTQSPFKANLEEEDAEEC